MDNKKTIVSVASLTVIALLATILLAVLNSVLPGAPAPGLAQALPYLEEMMPGSSFAVYDYDIDAFNNEYGSSSVKITLVVKASGGDNDSKYAVRLSTKGYSSDIDVLVGYNKDSSILGVATLNNLETDPNGNVYNKEGFGDAFVNNGKDPSKPISEGQIRNELLSGATNGNTTLPAYVAGVNLATRLAIILNQIVIVPEWQDANGAENVILRDLVDDQNALFSKASSDLLNEFEILSNADNAGLINIFVQRTGVNADKNIIIESINAGDAIPYGSISTMSIFENIGDNAKLNEIRVGTMNNSTPSRPSQNNAFNDFADKIVKISPTIPKSQWFGLSNGTQADWKDIFDIDTGASTGGNTGMSNSMRGYVFAVQAGFNINDKLNHAKLLEQVAKAPIPQPAWGVVGGDLPHLQAMVGNEIADFSKADNSMMLYHGAIQDYLPYNPNLFISDSVGDSGTGFTLTETNTKLIWEVFVGDATIRQSAFVMFNIDGTINKVVVGNSSFESNGTRYITDENRQIVNNALAIFDGATLDNIIETHFIETDENGKDVFIQAGVDNEDVPILNVPENGISNQITVQSIRNILQSIRYAFEVNAGLGDAAQLIKEAITPRWGVVSPTVLIDLRLMTGTKGSNGTVTPSNIDFVSADAKKLESVGALTPVAKPITPDNEQNKDEWDNYRNYVQLRNSIVNLFVAQDGTGRVIVEAVADVSRHPDLGSTGSANDNGLQSMLVLLEGGGLETELYQQ